MRRAIAVVPEVEEYKRRYEQKVAKYGKEVPDSTLNTMKGKWDFEGKEEGPGEFLFIFPPFLFFTPTNATCS